MDFQYKYNLKKQIIYFVLKRYDIFIIGGYERLITKVKETDETNF